MLGNHPKESSNNSKNIRLDSIEDAIADIKAGKLVIVVDDENRENEGDFLTAAENITPEMINFMATHGRGLICVPITQQRAKELELDLMVPSNSAAYETPFTVSVDLIAEDTSTGISASDRSKTIQAMINPDTRPSQLGRPGHVFPLKARDGGVLRRAGHTEATIDLARLAGMYPAGVLIEILNEDGTMARLPDLRIIADKFHLKLISIEDLISYRLAKEILVKREVTVNMPTAYGDFELIAFTDIMTDEQHLALVKGTWAKDEAVMVRVHSSCVTGDILGSMRCDCGDQLHKAMQMVQAEGKGVILYMNQEGRGIGLINKLKAYKLQEEGQDTVEANLSLGFRKDQRDYGIGAQILRELQVTKLKLLTNNPKKRIGLIGYGLEIVENLPIEIKPNKHNEAYLKTKRDKLGHEILKDSE